MKHWQIFGGATAASLLLLAGCNSIQGLDSGAKDSDQSREYQNRLNLDQGNYDAILNAPLGSVNPLDYAAAAMGAAGIDTQTMLDLVTAGPSGTANSTALSGLSFSASPADAQNLSNAVTQLNQALQADPNNTQLQAQAAFASMVLLGSGVAQVTGSSQPTPADINNAFTANANPNISVGGNSVSATVLASQAIAGMINGAGALAGSTSMVDSLAQSIDPTVPDMATLRANIAATPCTPIADPANPGQTIPCGSSAGVTQANISAYLTASNVNAYANTQGGFAGMMGQ